MYREIGGLVSIPNADEIRQAFGRDTFPLPLGGRSYEAFVERIRSLVANGRGSAAPPGMPQSEEWSAC